MFGDVIIPNMYYIDQKYLLLVSPQLKLFKKKSDGLYNFRCPYCGDSQKSRTKARGYVFRKKNDLFYKCHNCGHCFKETSHMLIHVIHPMVHNAFTSND